SLQKFATCLQHISQLLECPVCLEVIKPPGWQCCNGHVLCNNCRSRSVKCPVCRVPLGPRGRCLLSDKLFTLLAENFPCDGGECNQHLLTCIYNFYLFNRGKTIPKLASSLGDICLGRVGSSAHHIKRYIIQLSFTLCQKLLSSAKCQCFT
ncbi:GL20581, partial [Drosophila persimilis]